MNSTTLSALVTASGGSAHRLGIVPDSKEAILDKCEQALDQGADIVLVSGGSSVGARDYTLAVFERICKAPPLVHGVAIRPGKPTIIARSGDRALFGLPGHVASCIVVYLLFVHYLVKVMSGADPDTGLERKRAVCAEMFPSAIGREEYVRVRLERDADSGRLLARPIYGKSGLISTLVSADALVKIPRDSEGYHQGEEAEVMLLP